MSNGNNPSRGPRRQPNASQPTALFGAGRVTRARKAFQWGDVPATDVGELVQAITAGGAAIICGVTSDGGALSITILDGDERLRDWPSNDEEFRTFVEWVHNNFRSP